MSKNFTFHNKVMVKSPHGRYMSTGDAFSFWLSLRTPCIFGIRFVRTVVYVKVIDTNKEERYRACAHIVCCQTLFTIQIKSHNKHIHSEAKSDTSFPFLYTFFLGPSSLRIQKAHICLTVGSSRVTWTVHSITLYVLPNYYWYFLEIFHCELMQRCICIFECYSIDRG